MKAVTFKIEIIRNEQFNDLFMRINACKEGNIYIGSIDIIGISDGKHTNITKEDVENMISSFVTSLTKNYPVTINNVDIVQLIEAINLKLKNMETKELSKEELLSKIESLESDLKRVKEDSDIWYNKARETEKKFSAFRDMVKGLVVLIE